MVWFLGVIRRPLIQLTLSSHQFSSSHHPFFGLRLFFGPPEGAVDARGRFGGVPAVSNGAAERRTRKAYKRKQKTCRKYIMFDCSSEPSTITSFWKNNLLCLELSKETLFLIPHTRPTSSRTSDWRPIPNPRAANGTRRGARPRCATPRWRCLEAAVFKIHWKWLEKNRSQNKTGIEKETCSNIKL